MAPDAVAYRVERLRIPLIPFESGLAKIAASMWPATRTAGLSLGDRACLAVGLDRQLPAMTTDQAWTRADVGVKVEVIRQRNPRGRHRRPATDMAWRRSF